MITIPFQKKDKRALEIVQGLMEPIILRRTKDMKDENGESIVPLPPKTIDIVYLEFDQEEKELYKAFSIVSIPCTITFYEVFYGIC